MITIIDGAATYFEMLLDAYKIKHTTLTCYDGVQWKFDDFSDADIVIHSGSYYNQYGYLESYGFPWDMEDVSVCTPHEMIKRILKYQGKKVNADSQIKYSIEDLSAFSKIVEKYGD